MEPLGRAAGMFCGCLALAAVVWASRYSPWAVFREQRVSVDDELAWQERKKTLQVFADDLNERERKRVTKTESKPFESPEPKVADKPPFPKLVIDANPFDAGSVPVGKMQSHQFKIKNVGEAPLVIYPIVDWHCGSWRRQVIPPAASAEIEIRFTIREPTPYFTKTFPLWTNDPDRQEIQLKIIAHEQRRP